MNRKAVIFGIKGKSLTFAEKKLFKREKPWGIILFSRNIKDISQLKTLISQIKKIYNDKNFPILIDQEGGSVSRLNKIVDFTPFSQNYFGKLFRKDRKTFFKYYTVYIEKVCDILKKVGININTVPVLDVLHKRTNKAIKDRSFSSDPRIVLKMGKICIDLYSENKIGTVVKHIPGHGLAKSDSHYHLPIINSKIAELKKIDFKPFKCCKSPFAMTAHVIYSKFDSFYTVTHSKILIKKVIRKHIGFKGLLISDDISMKALKYGLVGNAVRALEAGCAFINAIPVFIASDMKWQQVFADKNLPIAGDDVMSQLGATVLHKTLVKLLVDRGVKVDETYQLNIGGDTDFYNMLDEERLEDKRKSKSSAVKAMIPYEVPMRIGPSDFVHFLDNEKVCYVYLKGRYFGNIPVEINVKLNVIDAYNSAGVMIDAIRGTRIALDRSIAGPLTSISAYCFKHPPEQMSYIDAKNAFMEFVEGKRER